MTFVTLMLLAAVVPAAQASDPPAAGAPSGPSWLAPESAALAVGSGKGVRRVLKRHETWLRLGGPPGGLGYDIRVKPENADVMFVTDAYAGIHRSTDGGRNWTPVNGEMESCTWCGASIFCATVDPHDSSTIWVGTQFTGHIYRSTDSGDHWVQRDTGLTFTDELRSLRGITVDPGDPNVVYAALEVALHAWSDGAPLSTPGRGAYPCGGEVYKSLDAGATWTLIWKGNSLARYVWVDPRETKRLYVSTGMFDRDAADADKGNGIVGGVGILRSDDGGATWTVLDESRGLGGRFIPSLFMHPTDPDLLFAAVCTPNQTGGGFVSRNRGDSWELVLPVPPGWGLEAVEISTADPDVWYGARELVAYRSDDAGVTWHEYALGTSNRPAGVPIDLQVDPRDPLRIFDNNYGGGNFVSEDGGETWSDASTGYSGSSIIGLTVVPGNGGTVYAGSYRSTDGGRSWQGNAVPISASLVLVPVPAGAPLKMLAGGVGKVHRTNDGGTTWQVATLAETGPGAGAVRALAVAPSDPQTVYAGFGEVSCYFVFGACYVAQRGIFRSNDGGETFQALTSATFASGSVLAFAVDPADAKKLFAASGHSLKLSTDGGDTWQDLAGFESEAARYVTAIDVYQADMGGKPVVYDVVIDPFEPGIVYAACLPGVVLRSSDGGQTWGQVAAGMDPNESVVDLLADPSHQGVLYAASQQSGVFVTTDRGQTWRKLDPGFAVPNAAALALSSDGSVLYAGSAVNTRGAGAFRLGTPR